VLATIEKAAEYHGPTPPGEGWVLSGEGPKGGKIWKRTDSIPGGEPTLKKPPADDPVNAAVESFRKNPMATAKDAREANQKLRDDGSKFRLVPDGKGGWNAMHLRDLGSLVGERSVLVTNPLTGKPDMGDREYFEQARKMVGDTISASYVQTFNDPEFRDYTAEDIAVANKEMADDGSKFQLAWNNEWGKWTAVKRQRKTAKSFTAKSAEYHGPKPPGDNWHLVSEGPRGGKIWSPGKQPKSNGKHQWSMASAIRRSPRIRNAMHHADDIAAKIVEGGKKTMRAAGAAGRKMRSVSAGMFKRLEARYGRRQALGIFGAANILSWGVTGVGAAFGVPVWVPGQTALTAVPFIVIAEVYKRARESMSTKGFDRLTDAQINELAEQLVKDLLAEWEQGSEGITAKSFTLKDEVRHQPESPGEGWEFAGEGPRGGKLWRHSGQPQGEKPAAPTKTVPGVAEDVRGILSANKGTEEGLISGTIRELQVKVQAALRGLSGDALQKAGRELGVEGWYGNDKDQNVVLTARDIVNNELGRRRLELNPVKEDPEAERKFQEQRQRQEDERAREAGDRPLGTPEPEREPAPRALLHTHPNAAKYGGGGPRVPLPEPPQDPESNLYERERQVPTGTPEEQAREQEHPPPVKPWLKSPHQIGLSVNPDKPNVLMRGNVRVATYDHPPTQREIDIQAEKISAYEAVKEGIPVPDAILNKYPHLRQRHDWQKAPLRRNDSPVPFAIDHADALRNKLAARPSQVTDHDIDGIVKSSEGLSHGEFNQFAKRLGVTLRESNPHSWGSNQVANTSLNRDLLQKALKAKRDKAVAERQQAAMPGTAKTPEPTAVPPLPQTSSVTPKPRPVSTHINNVRAGNDVKDPKTGEFAKVTQRERKQNTIILHLSNGSTISMDSRKPVEVRKGWKAAEYHGPNPPGEGWVQTGEGPKGGKIWQHQGEPESGPAEHSGEKKQSQGQPHDAESLGRSIVGAFAASDVHGDGLARTDHLYAELKRKIAPDMKPTEFKSLLISLANQKQIELKVWNEVRNMSDVHREMSPSDKENTYGTVMIGRGANAESIGKAAAEFMGRNGIGTKREEFNPFGEGYDKHGNKIAQKEPEPSPQREQPPAPRKLPETWTALHDFIKYDMKKGEPDADVHAQIVKLLDTQPKGVREKLAKDVGVSDWRDKDSVAARILKRDKGAFRGTESSNKSAAGFTLKAEEYHGPTPPGEGWTYSGEGPKGGKIWTRQQGKGGEKEEASEKKKAEGSPDTNASFLQSLKEQSSNGGMNRIMGEWFKKFARDEGDHESTVDAKGNIEATHGMRAHAKANLTQQIAEILSKKYAGTPVEAEAEALVEEYNEEHWEDVVDEEDALKGAVAVLVNNWAESSNDHNALSRAIQGGAKEFFNVKDSFNYVGPSGSKKEIALQDKTEEMREKYSGIIHAYLEATYENTQEFFKKAGIKELVLYRGMKLEGGKIEEKWTSQDGAETALQPLSSFSTSFDTAHYFADSSRNNSKKNCMMIAVRVPIERVFSTALTGAGCLTEAECVVLGGKIKCNTAAWTHIAPKIDLATNTFAGSQSGGPTYEQFHK
jgi:hypothetical protein